MDGLFEVIAKNGSGNKRVVYGTRYSVATDRTYFLMKTVLAGCGCQRASMNQQFQKTGFVIYDRQQATAFCADLYS